LQDKRVVKKKITSQGGEKVEPREGKKRAKGARKRNNNYSGPVRYWGKEFKGPGSQQNGGRGGGKRVIKKKKMKIGLTNRTENGEKFSVTKEVREGNGGKEGA